MSVRRNPRYKNKRSIDPQMKCFLDENGIEESPDWGLPVPNPAAAYKSLSKYEKDLLYMSPEMVEKMNKAWNWTERHFGPYMCDSRVRSAEEVIVNLDKTTSTGVPFNQEFQTKNELLENDELFVEWINNDWELLATDPEWTSPSTSSLKEEIRPTAKIKDNKIRTFMAMATDITIHGNRLFADMNEKMNASYLCSASAVGMSPFEGNWNRLYHKLNTFSKGYALDESEYDSSLRAYMMWGCAQFRWKMLRSEDQTPENLARLKTIYRNLVNTLIVTADGVMVFKLAGNPSGSMNTINDNTLILYTLMAFAWIVNCPNAETSYTEFEDNTAKALVGDDNTWTVSDYAHDFFNGSTVIATWKSIGVTTTTDSLEPRSPEELDFLSAHTVFLDGKAIPVYDRTKLMTSLLYSPHKKRTPATTLQRTTAMLLVGWTDLPFRKFCRELIQWLLKKYDAILADEPSWIIAKCGILTDSALYQLYMGKTVVLQQQGLFEDLATEFGYAKQYHMEKEKSKLLLRDDIKINKLNKKDMMNVVQVKRKRNRKNNKLSAERPSALLRRVGAGGYKPPQNKRKRNKKPRNRNQSGISGAMPKRKPQGLISKGSSVTEREEILDIVGNGSSFAVVQQLALNPGQAGTFPTLSKQAVIWQRYRFKKLRFEYQPEVNEFATAGTTGKIIMQVNIDAADGPPTTKQGAYATDKQLVNSDLPSRGFSINVPAKYLMPLGKDWRYVRQAGLPGAADIHEYDVGNLFISTTGTIDNSTKLGELHVYYTVEFENLLNSTLESAPMNNQVSQFQSTAGETLTTTIAHTVLYADVSVPHGFANGLIIPNVSGVFTPPPGNYIVSGFGQVTFTGNSTVLQVNLQKNGTDVFNNAPVWQNNFPSIAASQDSYNFTYYVTANGTDTFQTNLTATFSTGSATAFAVLTWLAV